MKNIEEPPVLPPNSPPPTSTVGKPPVPPVPVGSGGALPIFIVTGSNWTCEVTLNEFNRSLEVQHQVHEAASIALSVFKGLKNDPPLLMFSDAQNDVPQIGTLLLVTLKGGDPNQGVLILTHLILANIGAYSDSIRMQAELDKQTAKIVARIKKDEDAKKAEIEVFKRLKKSIIKKPTKVKKKINKKK